MATQTDVQQLIQGLTPSNNSGNPNTAYNNPNPTIDAYGNWFGGTVNPAASITLESALPASSLPMSRPNFPTLPALGTIPTTPFFPTVPTPTTPTTPTPTTPITPWTPPTQIGGGGTTTPPPTANPSTGGNLNAQLGNALTNSGALGNYTRGSTSTGNTGTGINWQQVVDVAGDVLGLPGNWYLNGFGGWDASNMLTSTLSTLTGMPVGSIMNMLGKYGINAGWDSNNMFVDHYLDNQRNDYANTYGTVGPTVPNLIPAIPGVDTSFASQQGVPNINLGYAEVPNYDANWNPFRSPLTLQTYNAAIGNMPVSNLSNMGYSGSQINQLLGASGSTTTRLSPQSTAAINNGATVLEGDAARAFMDSMKNQRTMQTGADALGRKYER